jgi:hypothetical protein
MLRMRRTLPATTGSVKQLRSLAVAFALENCEPDDQLLGDLALAVSEAASNVVQTEQVGRRPVTPPHHRGGLTLLFTGAPPLRVRKPPLEGGVAKNPAAGPPTSEIPASRRSRARVKRSRVESVAVNGAASGSQGRHRPGSH